MDYSSSWHKHFFYYSIDSTNLMPYYFDIIAGILQNNRPIRKKGESDQTFVRELSSATTTTGDNNNDDDNGNLNAYNLWTSNYREYNVDYKHAQQQTNKW